MLGQCCSAIGTRASPTAAMPPSCSDGSDGSDGRSGARGRVEAISEVEIEISRAGDRYIRWRRRAAGHKVMQAAGRQRLQRLGAVSRCSDSVQPCVFVPNELLAMNLLRKDAAMRRAKGCKTKFNPAQLAASKILASKLWKTSYPARRRPSAAPQEPSAHLSALPTWSS